MELNLTGTGSLSIPHLELLNTIADEIELSYNEMINRIGTGNEHNIDWWVSEISSRNTYSSRLFGDCCLLIFAKKILGQEPGITKIKIDSIPLYKVLNRYVCRHYSNITVLCTAGWQQRLKFILYPVVRYFYAILIYLTRYLTAKFTISHLTGQLPSGCTLVDVFVFDHSFAGGVFQDRYFHGFDKYLSRKEAQTFFYIPAFLISFRKTVPIFLAMNKSQQRFLPKEGFLKPSDYVFAFLYPFRALALIPDRTDWQDFDLTPMLRSIWYYHLSSMATIEGLLNYRFAARLKEAGVSLRLVIDWFENQIVDRGANAGFRKFYPEVPVIGYSSMDIRHYLCMAHPTSAEQQAGVLPQVVAVSGKGFEASKKSCCPQLKTTTAPAFRYGWVWKSASAHPDPNYTTVLVALSLLREESLNSLKAVIGAVRYDLPPQVRFWVKPHPAATSMQKLMSKAGITFPPGFVVIDGDFAEKAERADIIVGNESGTVLEVLARGTPVIIIGHPSRITIHAIPEAVPRGLWQLCYSPLEVAQAIKYFINRSKDELQRHREAANNIREQYFEPITQKGVRKFLLLGG